MIPQEQFIISELGLSQNSPEEQRQITAQIKEHMQSLAFDTILHNMTEEQLEKLDKELDKTKLDEDKLMRLAAEVPLLQDKIQKTLQSEWETIKQAYKIVK